MRHLWHAVSEVSMFPPTSDSGKFSARPSGIVFLDDTAFVSSQRERHSQLVLLETF